MMAGTSVRVAAIVIWLVVGGCAQRPPPGPPAPSGPPSAKAFTLRISVGDTLVVRVWPETALDSTQRVQLDGSITLPVAGRVIASGLTAYELQEQLVRRYVGLKEPTVTVEVKEVFASRAFFLGEVASPGAIYLAGPTSILQGLAQVGGLKESEADKKTIRIIRPGSGVGCKPQVYSVNLLQIITGCDCDVYLTPGDVVYVHPTSLVNWTRQLTLALAPLGAILGEASQIADVIIAAEAVKD